MTRWFGNPWPSATRPAPVCDPELHVPTPVGELCLYCPRSIAPEDQGVVLPYFGELGASTHAVHLSCLLRTVVGPQGALNT